MAKARYESQMGAKILMGVAFGLLVFAAVFIALSLAVTGRFNRFKQEVASISGDVKSKIVAEYHGEQTELSKKSFGRIFLAMVSSRRKEILPGASITDQVAFHLSNVGGQQAVMTVSRTDKGYVKVTYEADDCDYTYWFECGYVHILNLAGLTPC